MPDTLVSLPRAAPAVATTSQEVASFDVLDAVDSQGNILEEMEMSAAEQVQKRRRRKRDEDSPEQEEQWMKELSLTMKANQTLLEKLLEEKSQPQSERQPFINYISEMLRTVPQEQYVALTEGILDLVRARGRRDSWNRQQQYGYQQQQQPHNYYQLQPYQDQSTSWQYQPQGTQPPVQTPRRTRDSLETVGRILSANIGEDWSNPPQTPHLIDSPTIRSLDEMPSDDRQ